MRVVLYRWEQDSRIYNVKCTVVQALRLCTGRTAHRGSRGIALLFLDHGTRRCEESASRPGRLLPPEKIRYPLHRRLVGPHGWSGQVWKMSPLPGFDPRTIQPVANRYTNWATQPTIYIYIYIYSTQPFRKYLYSLSITQTRSPCIHWYNRPQQIAMCEKRTKYKVM